IAVSAPLSVTTTSPLTPAVTGTSYSVRLASTGGGAPFAWSLTSGSLPDGLEISSAGVISGTPSRAGMSTFSVQISDSSNLRAAKAFSLSVFATGIPTVKLENLAATQNPAQLLPIVMSVSPPQPIAMSGSVTMTFTSSSVIPANDPTVQFSTGSRTVAFTIP